jgi:hypothetical protein
VEVAEKFLNGIYSTLIFLLADLGQKSSVQPKNYTANVYRQTTDELMFKSVISTQR